ncbi:GntP family permease [Microaceticoccus formicicus]|uniref:GntP family permease n=1 Tax=Microaceticoccus formicicus TaxID=3118105 RepID=UPI003CD01398|nr:gluconate:H+ symporter [Peptoniphilaceae bacterium AMB_02]
MSNAGMMALLLVVSVGLLLFLVMKVKLHAFVSLLVVSIFMGLISGMDVSTIMGSIQNGMGGTLGFIATVVGLGAMFGKMLEISGGAERLARTFINAFGVDKSPWAMVISGFLVSIPVFFDVGFIILVPLVYALAKETKKSTLIYGIPLLAGLAVTHAFVPPTPGPILVANLVGADLGKVILIGIVAGIPAAILAGPVFGNYIGTKIKADVPDYMDIDNTVIEVKDSDLPGFGTIFALIMVPIVLILLNTVASAFLPEGGMRTFLNFVGHPFFALTLACILSFYILGKFKGLSAQQVQDVASAALTSTGMIILVTGAGGVFKQVLVDSGIGKTLAEALSQYSMSPIILAFLIALVVRVAAGSATVAMTTAGAIIAPLLVNFNVEPALIVVAIASGSTALSHVNDSGFWLVNRYFGINEKDTLKSWTVMETIIGVTGLCMALILNIFL